MREQTTLGEVLSRSGGSIKTGPFGTVLKACEYSNSGVPLISASEVGNGVLQIHERTPRVDAVVVDRLPEYVLRLGDIVFGRKGAVNRSAWVREHEDGYFLGSDGIRVRFGHVSTSRFMAFQFRSAEVRDWLIQHAAGTTMASLNQKILERLPVMIPDRRTQDAVAEVLGALDDKIAANLRTIETVGELLAVRLAGALNGGVVPIQLGHVADVNSISIAPRRKGYLRYVDISSLGVGKFKFPNRRDWADAPGRARRGIRRGDTLWSTVRPSRRSHALNLSDDPELVGSTGLAVLTPRDVGFAYLYEVTHRPEFSAYLESVAEGSAYPAVRAERFFDAEIPLLPQDAREAFEAVAVPLREMAWGLDSQNRSLAALRDALLPGLMSGRIKVKDAEDRVGEVL
jgi:type I restriction enzyme, S subunit